MSASKVTMRDVSHYGPSLSVKFHGNDMVYAAVGPFIQIYNYNNADEIHRVRVFKKNKVHGFAFSDDGENCVFYGAKSVVITSVESLLATDDISNLETLATEWIVAAEFNKDTDKIFLLTCYNLVIVVDLRGNILERKSLTNERSILYSGSIRVLGDDRVIINAGTVMGGVLIWDLHSETTIHNLTGHEGSIFFVTVSNDGKLVASCSDDRSIRLWDMDTGKELAVGWGHTARIWNLKFFDNNTKIISVSEDCTCRVWELNKITASEFEMDLVDIFEVHLTKNVWGVDVKEDDMVAATSGNDGRIKLIDLKQSSRHGNENESFSITQIGNDFNINFMKDEIIKGFEWFDFGLVAITSLGKIIRYDDYNKAWKLLMVDERLVSYSVTNSVVNSTGDNVVIFSNNKSDILMLNISDDGHEIIGQRSLHIEGLSKTTNVMTLLNKEDDKSFFVTMESPNPRDNFVILKVSMKDLDITTRYEFNKPNNFVSSCVEIYKHYLLIGSRFSTIAIFDLNKSSMENYSPFIIKRINAGDTMTSIKYIENRDGNQLFSVTNRDGYYNFISIRLEDGECNEYKYEIIHSNKVIKGFLEGGFYNSRGEYITFGFKSSLFYMYNEQNCYEIVSQVCGGAHRQWKLRPLSKSRGDDNDESFMLVYIKASTLYFRRIYGPFKPEILVNGLHGREIRDLSICSDARRANGNYLFVTGSEDTSIKLNEMNPDNGKIRTIWTERKHVSGLQRLKMINRDMMVSSSAREELFLWKINDKFESNPYMHAVQTLPTSSTNPDLRIMDFDVLYLDAGESDVGGDFLLSTVYSDSSVKLWHYDSERNAFQMVLSDRYKTCCILNTNLVEFCGSTYLLISSTDGYLVVYKVPSELDYTQLSSVPLEMELSLPLHQSGIKTMDIRLDGSRLNVFAGGDDNAVSLTVIGYNEVQGQVECIKTSTVADAGSSTITSCQFITSAEGTSTTRMVSTSVDQIVRVWEATPEDELQLCRAAYTTVADTGSCDTLDERLALIGGVGISVWTL